MQLVETGSPIHGGDVAPAIMSISVGFLMPPALLQVPLLYVSCAFLTYTSGHHLNDLLSSSIIAINLY